MERKKILLFADWYEPGYKAGGPIRSCVNFARQMGQYYDMYVFTSDRDLGSSDAYEGLATDQWIEREGGIKVFYCSPSGITLRHIREQIKSIRPELIYLNSMFSKGFTVYPLLAVGKVAPGAKTILSPRGMLRDSALRFKPLKKKLFLNFIRWTGIHRRLHFHASDETEQKDIRLHFGKHVQVTQIANLPAALPERWSPLIKTPGELSLIFVGRIHPIKNLDYLLERLSSVSSTVKLSIIGSREDPAYWEKCQEIIKTLPALVSVRYLGEIPNHEIPAITREHHIFALPTRGENFGHAIFEALCLKKPVLISDQTPWRHLRQACAGWDLPLDDPDAFGKAIAEAAAWGQQEYDEWSGNAFDLARRYINDSAAIEKYRGLFS